jgi:hypothetical protein
VMIRDQASNQYNSIQVRSSRQRGCSFEFREI